MADPSGLEPEEAGSIPAALTKHRGMLWGKRVAFARRLTGGFDSLILHQLCRRRSNVGRWPFKPENAGSSPVACSNAPLAQLAEALRLERR